MDSLKLLLRMLKWEMKLISELTCFTFKCAFIFYMYTSLFFWPHLLTSQEYIDLVHNIFTNNVP
jgi:hypothetical protein